MKKLFALLPFLALGLHAVETDYKHDIDVYPSGTEFVDFAFERPCEDPKIDDHKITYTRSTTTLTMAHNERNFYWSGSGPTRVTAGTGDAYGVPRYKIDSDLQWKRWFAGNGGVNLNTAYTAPFTFADLTYPDDGVTVVGHTGSNGVELTLATRSTHYWRGIQTPFNEELHLITTADSDEANPDRAANYEFWASGGGVNIYNVDPATPFLCPTRTGNAQWFTTPVKAHFQPRAVVQTTYFMKREGTIKFTLGDLFGAHVFYRINSSGAFTDGGAGLLELTDAHFPLTGEAAPNKLEYRCGASGQIKVRWMVKNPDFPSKLDPGGHGTRFLGRGDTMAKRLAQLKKSGTAGNYWINYYNTQPGNNGRLGLQTWDDGDRNTFSTGAIEALIGLGGINGKSWTSVATGVGVTATYFQLAKLALVDNFTAIDPVDMELNPAGTSTTNSSAIACRDVNHRGYRDVDKWWDHFVNYDIMIGNCRIDQAGFETIGLSPIDDIRLRFGIAGTIQVGAILNAQYTNYGISTPGMWDTARASAAMSGGCYVIPSFASEVYGSCGLAPGYVNGVLGSPSYYGNPFPTEKYTWKELLIDEFLVESSPGVFIKRTGPPVGTFPNYCRGLGIENSPYGLFDANGLWRDKSGYLSIDQMAGALARAINMSKIHNPSRDFPGAMKAFTNLINGTQRGVLIDGPGQGRQRMNIVYIMNSRFPEVHEGGLAWVTPLVDPNPNRMPYNMTRSFALGLLWVDEPAVRHVNTIGTVSAPGL